MREIKFRAWDTQYKQWVIPYDITILGDGTVVADRRGDYNGDIIDTIERPTLVVEQFTGLHDKNGREIYEGDIVRTWVDLGPAGEEEVVTAITISPWGINLQKWTFDESYYPEVIGNIHENQELLND